MMMMMTVHCSEKQNFWFPVQSADKKGEFARPSPTRNSDDDDGGLAGGAGGRHGLLELVVIVVYIT